MRIRSYLDFRMSCRHKRMFIPETDHLCLIYAIITPEFPYRRRITGSVIISCGCAEKHSQPAVASILQHICHYSERYSGGTYEPLITCKLIIPEMLAIPYTVYIWIETDILLSCSYRIYITRVQIYQGAIRILIHDPAESLHYRSVESDIIHVDSIDTVIDQHPAQSFQIIIYPAGKRCKNKCGICILFREFSIPCRRVPIDQMFLMPRGSITSARRKYFSTKRVQGINFMGIVGQLTNSVIQLHFCSIQMLSVHIGFEFITNHKRILYDRVQRSRVMKIQHSCSVCLCVLETAM